MSFGWSAGGIATAVKLIYSLIQALNSCDGAASDYREAVGFLRDLNRTLDPLQSFAAWRAYPSYAKDIEEQVAQVREPVESFLKAVTKFEPSLRQYASSAYHRDVFKKLHWHILVSKKVLALRKRVESHMRIIDTLVQRLTLDIVSTIQTQLPRDLRTVVDDALRPDLMNLLRENLLPLHEKLLANVKDEHDMQYERLAAKTFECYEGLSSDVQWIKQNIGKPSQIQEEINSALSGSNSSRKLQPKRGGIQGDIGEEREESLRDIYYLVFLYLGLFLKNLLLALSRLVIPSRALMPTLLAKYNISFLDALGRSPRILPYEFFQSLEILQAFVKHEFRFLPGSSLVHRGDYLLISSIGERVLTTANSNTLLRRGSTVTMSVVSRKLPESSSDSATFQCPQEGCTGQLQSSATSRWSTWCAIFSEVRLSPYC
ncbi:uncharacterized protein K444DRAFT_301242 [Hyaloscypha bicolor E]|uniref:Ubiquitin-like domain-containing protein n=1 Tax=Hyaloscypha bicolor E TaxID=1095630 RepID=A0A2J6SEB9_9HELO|nr:uncharacterized protein K444DRAFT_301242 [Hyaloscypha bicolor E]PMD49113.1 hypothetical protein K444DRAFT_301242 [Hyaloscypha bicolor E]